MDSKATRKGMPSCILGVEYLVVGVHALAAHGHVRATKSLDI